MKGVLEVRAGFACSYTTSFDSRAPSAPHVQAGKERERPSCRCHTASGHLHCPRWRRSSLGRHPKSSGRAGSRGFEARARLKATPSAWQRPGVRTLRDEPVRCRYDGSEVSGDTASTTREPPAETPEVVARRRGSPSMSGVFALAQSKARRFPSSRLGAITSVDSAAGNRQLAPSALSFGLRRRRRCY